MSSRRTAMYFRLHNRHSLVHIQWITASSRTAGCDFLWQRCIWSSTVWDQEGLYKIDSCWASLYIFLFCICSCLLFQILWRVVSIQSVALCFQGLLHFFLLWLWATLIQSAGRPVSSILRKSIVFLCDQPWQDLALPLLPAIKDLFNIPRSIGGKSDAETVSFEAIQLSTQGAERQKKDVFSTSIGQMFGKFFIMCTNAAIHIHIHIIQYIYIYT